MEYALMVRAFELLGINIGQLHENEWHKVQNKSRQAEMSGNRSSRDKLDAGLKD